MAGELTPESIADAIRQVEEGCLSTSGEWASDMQARMRSEAPWHDRNGPSMTGKNARESLEAEAGRVGDEVVIVLRSDRRSTRIWKKAGIPAPVAAFLELGTRFMAKREVIRPVQLTGSSDLRDRLQRMLAPDM